MEVAPGILARTFTAPVSSHSRMNNSQSSSATPNTFSIGSRPSRSSNSTQDTTASLFALRTSPPPNGTIIEATNNVINRVAEKETSLYQQCITLRNRLRAVPGFSDEYQRTLSEAAHAGETPSSVDLLWRTLRRGYCLVSLFNACQPLIDSNVWNPIRLSQTATNESKREKDASYKFIQACHQQLKLPQSEIFMLAELNGEDTAGLVKVVNVVSRVVDMLVHNGIIETDDSESIEEERRSQRLSQGKRTQRQHIVNELVRTERTYVQHLDLLQTFKKEAEQQGLISGDIAYAIFLNLNQLLDVQRRFLIFVEEENGKDEEDQNWGRVFADFGDNFGVYEAYIINQNTCEATARDYFDKLMQIQGSPELVSMVESSQNFTGFLLKPFARLCKYPLLLKELLKNGQLDEERRENIQQGIAVVDRVLDSANRYVTKQEHHKIVQDLREQVEDWKNHRVELFGDLLLYGNFQVVKGDGMNTEREYKMYLFEKILLCCKEIGTSKKGKISTKPAPPPTRNGKPRMALKGRIFMSNVSEVNFGTNKGKFLAMKIGSKEKIYWRADDNVEYFIIRFPNEDLMRKWEVAITEQRRLHGERLSRSVTSETEFKYMQDANIENPYKEDELDDEDSFNYPDSAMSRNASSTSLRSRSTTGESIPPGISMRNGKQHAPLTLRTQHLYGAVSPQDRFGNANSYFSPGADSPVSYSSRTSSSSGIMPLHSRQSGPMNGYMEDNNRFTAPAAGYVRQNGRDSGNGYNPVDPRSGRYPVPPHQAALSNRMRSASSPDVHTLNTNIRAAGQNGAPPIPSVPSHLSNSIVNRSQNSSPVYSTNLRGSNDAAHLMRTQTMSPPVMSPTSSFGGDNGTPKVRVKVKTPSESSTMTLQVDVDVDFQTLRNKIDAKLTRFTQQTLANGSLKLKYLYDDEFVTIQTDEDVQTAFETWHDQVRDPTAPGQEIELYCHR